jgi:hypothetical protein
LRSIVIGLLKGGILLPRPEDFRAKKIFDTVRDLLIVQHELANETISDEDLEIERREWVRNYDYSSLPQGLQDKKRQG